MLENNSLPPKVRDDMNRIMQHLNKGQVNDAEAILDPLLKSYPKFPLLWELLADLKLQQRQFNEGLQALLNVVRIDYNNVNAHANLAHLYFSFGDGENALLHIERAIELVPQQAEFKYLKSKIQRAKRDRAGAMQTLKEITAGHSNHFLAHNDLGVDYMVIGDFDKAKKFLSQAITLNPEYCESYSNYVSMGKLGEESAIWIEKIERQLANPKHADIDKAHLHFAMAKVYDGHSNYEKAVEHYASANKLVKNKVDFNHAAMSDFVKRSQDIYTNDLLQNKSGFSNKSSLPLLIVGMPRSGTTLLEQQLIKHPSISTAGELEFFPSVANNLPTQMNMTADAYPQCATALSKEIIEAISQQYLSILQSTAESTQFIIDKLPMNFMHLGMAKLLFSNCKIIYVTRENKDNAISLYTTFFTYGNDFAYDLEDIKFMQTRCIELMDHWRRLFGDNILTISYESLVTDIENSLAKIYEFLEIDPSADNSPTNPPVRNNKEGDNLCLANEIESASHWQARQKVHSNSLARWKKYGPFLPELK